VAISRKLLTEDERVVVSTRTHIKALLLPAVWLILLAGAAGFLSTLPSGSPRPVLILVIWLVVLVLALWLVVKPFVRWLSTTYTVTNHRLITRTGIVTRRGHDIPLVRISDVAYEHGLIDRMLGCGTLLISDASEHGRVVLHDIPQVERVQLEISELLHGHAQHDTHSEARRFDDGT
jgi:uncharacterized membrane protein YdbT with pleckstrin-like domain